MTVTPPDPPECRTLDGIDPSTLYTLLRLRVDVFVVEQDCAYPELDGADLDDTTRHWWYADHEGPISYLRTLVDVDGVAHVGRVVTAPRARGAGLAARLIDQALDTLDGPVVVQAQAHLADWYSQFGFTRAGDDVVEDGILHTPMRLDPTGRRRLLGDHSGR